MKHRICHISDTHDTTQDFTTLIPDDTDILFHTGDMTYRGTFQELNALIVLFAKAKQKVRHVVVIPGNHEVGCQATESLWREAFAAIDVHFLIHEAIEIEGIRIFGSPWTPAFGRWAYNVPRGDEARIWDQIPEDTQVLLTHGPPHLILDLCDVHVGCMELRHKVLYELPDLRYHLFGHIHSGYGTEEHNGILFSNAALMDESYKMVNIPNCFELKL